jgi:hypothetical protein
MAAEIVSNIRERSLVLSASPIDAEDFPSGENRAERRS